MKKRRSYKRLFRDPKKVALAIKLLNEGLIHDSVGKILGCNVSSISSFKQRMIKQGVVFKEFKRRIRLPFTKEEKIEAEKLKKFHPEYRIEEADEPMNPGKKTYKAYLKEYNKKTRKQRKQLMTQAKKNVEEARQKMGEDFDAMNFYEVSPSLLFVEEDALIGSNDQEFNSFNDINMIEDKTGDVLKINEEEGIITEPEKEVPSELGEECEVVFPIHETADGQVIEHPTEE